MTTRPDLRLLFATDLSASSQRACRMLSRLAARCRVDVTFVHVASPDGRSDAAERALDAFVAKAALSYAARAVVLEGHDAARAVADHCASSRFDLVVAPPGDRPSIAGFLGTSFRARLLQRCQVPLWSGGGDLDAAHADRPLTAVGCVVDLDETPERHLRRAWAFADRMGARLHVVSTVPPIDDGTLARVASSRTPLDPASARAWIEGMLPGVTLGSLDVTVDDGRVRLHQALARHKPDVVFVGPHQWTSAVWPVRYPRYLDRLGYPVICLGSSRAGAAWSFQEVSSWIGADEGARTLARATG